MESVPRARSIATSDAPWLCDVVADAASLSLAGNDTCTALSRLVQEAVEPATSKKHFHLTELTQRACDDSRKQKLDKYARLIQFSRRAQALANAYADVADAESLPALAEMHQRMTELSEDLEERGCTLRSDSAMCRTFVEDGIGHPPSIVDTMEEMKFYFEHTAYRAHMQQWHFSDFAKEVALKEWVLRHGALSTLIPQSLRDAAAGIAVEDALSVPVDLMQRARELIRGLDNVGALLALQAELAPRLEAAKAAMARVKLLGRDAPAFFGTEADVLKADEDTYQRRRATSRAMWDRGEFTCTTCKKSWGSARQLADHYRGRHGVVPDGL